MITLGIEAESLDLALHEMVPASLLYLISLVHLKSLLKLFLLTYICYIKESVVEQVLDPGSSI